ncbi:MAG: PKD domain-containing protein [Flavobacteriaceae bacterium]
MDGRYYHLLVEEPITEEEVLEIVNTNGCVLERVSIAIAIGEVDFYLQALSSLANNHVRVGEEVVFFNTSSSPYTRSEWSFGDGSNRIERDRVSETISPTLHRYLTEGSFSVQLKIFNATGCYSEVTQQIYVGKGYSIHTPNTFTPNDDFINDRFRPLITGFVQASLSVYDFRGNLLYLEFHFKDGTARLRPQGLKPFYTP